jgi:hypothetical protein
MGHTLIILTPLWVREASLGLEASPPCSPMHRHLAMRLHACVLTSREPGSCIPSSFPCSGWASIAAVVVTSSLVGKATQQGLERCAGATLGGLIGIGLSWPESIPLLFFSTIGIIIIATVIGDTYNVSPLSTGCTRAAAVRRACVDPLSSLSHPLFSLPRPLPYSAFRWSQQPSSPPYST